VTGSLITAKHGIGTRQVSSGEGAVQRFGELGRQGPFGLKTAALADRSETLRVSAPYPD
jgi:hypothetical protein